MLKRTFMTLITLIIIGSLGFSSFLVHGMYERYEDTVKWENSSMLSEIHQVPPSLAKNYITPEEKRLFNVLTDVNISLNEIIKDGEVKESKQGEYWDIYDEALVVIEDNEEIYEAFPEKEIFEDFSLYLNADLTIKKAYDELNTEKLGEYSKLFAKRLSGDNVKVEKHLFEQLKNISNDYFVLNEFSRNAISQLGIVEKDILKVGVQVDKSLTKSLLDEIETKKLSKFSHIKNLSVVLNSGPWNSILEHNIVTKEYYTWKESQEILESLLKANYVRIGSFKEVGDIIAYDSSIPLVHKAGYSIDNDSEVLGVYHNGSKMDEDLYIVRGASLSFDIDYKYTKTPEQYAREEIDIALETRDEDDIAAARKMVNELRDSEYKKQFIRELDNLEADIQREIEEEEQRIEEEKRREEELEREKEEQERIEREEQEEKENDDDEVIEDDDEIDSSENDKKKENEKSE